MNCETCGGDGVVFVIQLDRYVACPHCEKGVDIRQDWYQRRLKNAGLPARYDDAALSNYWDALSAEQIQDRRVAFEAAKMYVNGAGEIAPCDFQAAMGMSVTTSDTYRTRVIGFHGNTGTGKTHLAAAMCKNMMLRFNVSVKYIRLDMFVDGCFRRGDSVINLQDYIDGYAEAPDVLVLDEFNLSHLSDFAKQKIETLVRRRYELNRSIIVTTNLTPEQTQERFGDVIAGVLVDDALWVGMGGESLRGGVI